MFHATDAAGRRTAGFHAESHCAAYCGAMRRHGYEFVIDDCAGKRCWFCEKARVGSSLPVVDLNALGRARFG